MITWRDFAETGSVQTSVFTPGLTFATGTVLKIVLNLMPEMFDGQPTVLPLPDDAPREIPRIILLSNNRMYKIEVAPERLNFFRSKAGEEDHISCSEFISLAKRLLSDYVENIGARCGRLASVISRYYIVDNPAGIIAEHFCKEAFMKAPFDRPGAFELHAHKRYSLQGLDVNSWVRIKSGLIRAPNAAPTAVIFAEQDINTLAEVVQDAEYKRDGISTFYDGVCEEFDAILRLYFPEHRTLDA